MNSKILSTATELNNKDDNIQVATLRSLMGPECRKRLKDLNLTEEQSKKTESILTMREMSYMIVIFSSMHIN